MRPTSQTPKKSPAESSIELFDDVPILKRKWQARARIVELQHAGQRCQHAKRPIVAPGVAHRIEVRAKQQCWC